LDAHTFIRKAGGASALAWRATLDILLWVGHRHRVFIPRRLDKFLRDATPLSVAEIRLGCLSGRVLIVGPDGETAASPEPEMLVFGDDHITLDGSIVRQRTTFHYALFNKPRFMTVTNHDPSGKTCLLPVLQQMPAGVFAVGRLDRETSGALLFTDDGDFANSVLRPERQTEKQYWLWLDESLDTEDPRVKAFERGVAVSPERATLRVSRATLLHQTLDYTELLVSLHEGKNRHLRKMCNLLGLRLLQLHRLSIAGIPVEPLPVGQWRPLAPDEIEQVWTNTGGRAVAVRHKLLALEDVARRARQSATPHVRLEQWLNSFGQDGLVKF